jgi:hypothetical protein
MVGDKVLGMFVGDTAGTVGSITGVFGAGPGVFAGLEGGGDT